MPVDLSKFEGMTPGPWELTTWANVGEDYDGKPARVYGWYDGQPDDEPECCVCSINIDDPDLHAAHANAAAIAAVPDLIAEVRELRALLAENNE
jgi:hypothetical protein